MIETGRPRKRLPVPQEAIETETAGLRQERREDLELGRVRSTCCCSFEED